MTVLELIKALADIPLDAEVETPHGAVTGIARVERPGASPLGLCYVTLEVE
jgi:hypothetical protein